MTTDPRFARSSDSLAAAVLELASARPVETITVTEIARRAGVTRATFYNHATSPESLLAHTLEVELDAIRTDFLVEFDAEPHAIETIWRAAELDLIEHIERHAELYRIGLAPADGAHGSVLADVLAGHIEASLHTLAEASGAPREGEAGTRFAMAAAFVSQGTVGALRAWLQAPGPRDPQFAVDSILPLIPRMWFELAAS
ncbi:TetR/AcrR family transcriptional regulator [Demequina sp.]|uniref:TetR/AcrR family transcriptional regulator n=1 Tax=Demequina sp. TaxID=2050685 RepID=UPI0025EC33E2|nr:TetR/AcrR family transcriptional regulator [Demequina sp.]